jgi:D-3-phosphoglycerate dehydrogenase / 2-oxoglutarate reductase
MTTILITEEDYFHKSLQAKLAKIGDVQVIKPSALKQHIADADIILISLESKIDKPLIDKAKKLKIIGTPTTGLDHIDTDYAKTKGIEVISLKGDIKFLEDIDATAEHTIALLLSLIRKIPSAFNSVLNYSWDRKKFMGSELKYKTMGIIGCGRLGKKVAAIAQAFRMNVIYYDKNPTNGFEFVSKEELLKKSDIISIHLPLEPQTVNYLSKGEFNLIKKGAILINTSRGKIIDEEVLLEALKNKKLAGAAVDVLATENTEYHPKTNKLIAYAKEHDNLIITPHIAGTTQESMHMTAEHIVEKVIKKVKDNLLENTGST